MHMQNYIMERTDHKCSLEMEWTFSTISQANLEIVTKHKMSRIFSCLCWLLVHRAMPINGWRKGNVDKLWLFCMNLIETTTKHCLGVVTEMEIWKIITSERPYGNRKILLAIGVNSVNTSISSSSVYMGSGR